MPWRWAAQALNCRGPSDAQEAVCYQAATWAFCSQGGSPVSWSISLAHLHGMYRKWDQKDSTAVKVLTFRDPNLLLGTVYDPSITAVIQWFPVWSNTTTFHPPPHECRLDVTLESHFSKQEVWKPCGLPIGPAQSVLWFSKDLDITREMVSSEMSEWEPVAAFSIASSDTWLFCSTQIINKIFLWFGAILMVLRGYFWCWSHSWVHMQYQRSKQVSYIHSSRHLNPVPLVAQ